MNVDVERLAVAMHASYERDPAVERIEWPDLTTAEAAMWVRHARNVAAEYVRLADPNADKIVLVADQEGNPLIWVDRSLTLREAVKAIRLALIQDVDVDAIVAMCDDALARDEKVVPHG